MLSKHITAELARLDKREENLLDLAEDGQLTSGKVNRLNKIRKQRSRLEEKRAEVDSQLEVGAAFLNAVLDLLKDPETLSFSER